MIVEKQCVNQAYVLTIDGKQYSLAEAEPKLGIKATTLKGACSRWKKGEEFQLWIDKTVWKIKNDMPLSANVVTVDGQSMCSPLLQKTLGIGRTTAVCKIRRWRDGEISYKELLTKNVPREKYKPRKIKIVEPPAAEPLPENTIPGLQPRRHVESLGPAGTWEKQYIPEPQDGMGTGTLGRGHGHNSSGAYYIGD